MLLEPGMYGCPVRGRGTASPVCLASQSLQQKQKTAIRQTPRCQQEAWLNHLGRDGMKSTVIHSAVPHIHIHIQIHKHIHIHMTLGRAVDAGKKHASGVKPPGCRLYGDVCMWAYIYKRRAYRLSYTIHTHIRPDMTLGRAELAEKNTLLA